MTHEVRFSSEMHVEIIRHNATDGGVAEAARVSTTEISNGPHDPVADAGLIRYLMENRHGSPFEHNTMTFLVRAPIFVWREHMRHRVASYNEESGRYKTLKPEFYIPDVHRKLIQVGKPGSYTFEHGSNDQFMEASSRMQNLCINAYYDYEQMLAAGIAREVARMVLPISIYSSAYVTMNARALMNFLSLRLHDEESHFPSYPQREIEMIAEKYDAAFSQLMPITHNAFVDSGRIAP